MRFLGRKSNMKILLRRPGLFASKYRWPLALLVAGSVADAITTVNFMQEYGTGPEVHIVGRLVAETLGIVPGIIIAKTVQASVAVLVGSLWRWWCGWLIALAGLLYILASLSNHFHWL